VLSRARRAVVASVTAARQSARSAVRDVSWQEARRFQATRRKTCCLRAHAAQPQQRHVQVF